eukprot:CAMPEP_0117600666 /NCGR_PEP_ID=MMETSP0784-20121206/76612_1 /TAXON_ID=39447 /ORGANISM="" /LENGTH=172 /DNA_ID=CAMNT_0005403319 /DNA_START=57 /DNA_END=575 /DNA_ORIENTATION=+
MALPHELQLSWEVPDVYVEPIRRYDVVASMRPTIVRWCRLSCELILKGADIDNVLGNNCLALDEVPDDMPGHDALGKLDCGEALYTPIPANTPAFDMKKLVPGKSYHYIVRAVNKVGKGHWSYLKGPFATGKREPQPCQPLRLEGSSDSSCRFSFQLPYNNGDEIDKAPRDG